MGMMNAIKVIILAQLFFSFAITIIAHATAVAMPDMVGGLGDYENAGSQINSTSINSDLIENLNSQQNIPIVEVGALVFYSGNILIDVILNFITAIPTMITLLLRGIMELLSINSDAWAYFQLFATTAIGALYVLGALQFLLNLRSGRVA